MPGADWSVDRRGAASQRRWRGAGDQHSEEVGQEVQEGFLRPERNADADRWKEAGKGGSREEAGCESAQEIGVGDCIR